MTSIRHAERQSWWLLAVLAALIFVVAFPVYLDHNRSLQNKRNISELACILISQTPDDPAKPIIAEFRAKYRCPPFTKAALGHLAPRPTPTVTKTAVRAVPVPGPTSTATIVQPLPTTVTAPGVPLPGRTVTVTRTRIVTVTRTVSPPACFQNLQLPPCTLTAR